MGRLSKNFSPDIVEEAKKRGAALITIGRDGRFLPKGKQFSTTMWACGDPVAEKLAAKLIHHLLTREFPPKETK